jgi:hypothetical protein
MKRRTFIAATIGCATAGIALADSSQQVFDLFSKIASALSDDDPAMFVEALDPAMPGLQDFRRNLVALTDLADLTNSLEILTDTGDDNRRDDQLDWFLEIVGKSDPHPVERRRETVKFHLERKGKKWKIMSIDPIKFFAPPKIA